MGVVDDGDATGKSTAEEAEDTFTTVGAAEELSARNAEGTADGESVAKAVVALGGSRGAFSDLLLLLLVLERRREVTLFPLEVFPTADSAADEEALLYLLSLSRRSCSFCCMSMVLA